MSIKINQVSLETYKQILPAALQILNKAKAVSYTHLTLPTMDSV